MVENGTEVRTLPNGTKFIHNYKNAKPHGIYATYVKDKLYNYSYYIDGNIIYVEYRLNKEIKQFLVL